MYLLAACLFALVSCGPTLKEAMDSWLNHSESDLVSSWGAPNKVLDTRDGKRILTWESRWGDYGKNICKKTFTVDEKGIVRQWSYNNCPL